MNGVSKFATKQRSLRPTRSRPNLVGFKSPPPRNLFLGRGRFAGFIHAGGCADLDFAFFGERLVDQFGALRLPA